MNIVSPVMPVNNVNVTAVSEHDVNITDVNESRVNEHDVNIH